MTLQAEFDEWAASGSDREMENHHWHTAKTALAQMPVEESDTILDLGTGSGYALRALSRAHDLGESVGLDASPAMVKNAHEYTDTDDVTYTVGDFHHLPFTDDKFDHVWSMEAFFFSEEPRQMLSEIRRVLRSGGTFFCSVNFYEESEHTHKHQDRIDIPMFLWSRQEYRDLFRDAGLSVAAQTTIPDEEIDIPPEDEFPTEEWETRAAMVDRYRTWGTLLTVGVAP
ncbi:class I SAM-dependent methyltransferase [Halobacterium salinarum]|uniref:class I SAM-dependent methyltransferase n=1 Tax=Halobacterium salinarum TaxID=2242 RepID=UPI0025561C2A|nr:class I SAM-dependent methyltransferase [Halobacterium salinarum]MDL0131604.1 class I SAM-dependent methyltransferase [Halobacterium salinarum]